MRHRIVLALNLAMVLVFASMGSLLAQSGPGPRLTPEAPREEPPAASPTSPGTASDTSAHWTIASSRDIKVQGQPVAISPEGKWLAGPGPDKDVCVWEVATLEATCDGNDLAIQPETINWAPDSSAVAFSLEAGKYFVDSDIYIFDVRRGVLEDLTDDGLSGPIAIGTSPGAGPVNLDIFPAWSPDGTRLLFARTNWNAEARITTLMTISRAGGEPESLLALAPPEPLIVYSPMYWLADDSVLFSVWHADSHNGQNGLWRLTADGRVTQLLKGDASAEVPLPFVTSVLADGSLATVTSAALRNAQGASTSTPVFFLIDLATYDVVPVPAPDAAAPGFVSLPAHFSADGKTVVYAFRNGGQQWLAIAGQGDQAPTLLPFAATIAPAGYLQGLTLVAGQTLFIPTKGSSSGTGVILTLTPPAHMATPPASCGCTPPPAPPA